MFSSDFYDLKTFLKTKPFSVLPCDKNVGSIFILNSDHDKICFEHLNNDKVYLKLSRNPITDTISNVSSSLKRLKSSKLISSKLYKCLKIDSLCKSGSFRILAKIHKNKFGVRHIINCINTPTYKLCNFIEKILHPLLKREVWR